MAAVPQRTVSAVQGDRDPQACAKWGSPRRKVWLLVPSTAPPCCGCSAPMSQAWVATCHARRRCRGVPAPARLGRLSPWQHYAHHQCLRGHHGALSCTQRQWGRKRKASGAHVSSAKLDVSAAGERSSTERSSPRARDCPSGCWDDAYGQEGIKYGPEKIYDKPHKIAVSERRNWVSNTLI